MKIIGIYIVFNRISKKVYIGSSIDVVSRLRKHKNQLKLGKHPNRHLQLSFNKHGLESFKFTVIFQCEKDTTDNKLRQLEQEFINKVKPNRLYNICPVAGSTLGKQHSEETKIKISESLKMADRSNRIYQTGFVHTEETKQKISKTLKAAGKGKRFLTRHKPIVQYDVNTNIIIKEFDSITDAANLLDINRGHISEVCKGKRKTVSKMYFRYK